MGFNPRPAGWPGAALRNLGIYYTETVSILARLVGRALPAAILFRQDSWEFQSSPGWLAGRCPLQVRFVKVRPQFQSSPGWLAGRCRKKCTKASQGKCFNPRPAGWPGAAIAKFLATGIPVVSILARLVGRALLPETLRGFLAQKFQSSPGWLAGRCSRSNR